MTLRHANCNWAEDPPIRRKQKRGKSDSAKLPIAARLRKESTLPIVKIAIKDYLGTSRGGNVWLHEGIKMADAATTVPFGNQFAKQTM